MISLTGGTEGLLIFSMMCSAALVPISVVGSCTVVSGG